MLPLVLLPGMNCTADLWTGCGVDDALTPVLDEQSIDTQVDRLLAELPPRFVLGGLSLGAIVAMALVARAPERVERLCLVSTNAKAPTPEQRASWRTWIDRLDAGESAAESAGRHPRRTALAGRGEDRPDLVERTLAMADATGHGDAARAAADAVDPRRPPAGPARRDRPDAPRVGRAGRDLPASVPRGDRRGAGRERASSRSTAATCCPSSGPTPSARSCAAWRDPGALRRRGEDRPPVVLASSVGQARGASSPFRCAMSENARL